MATPPMLSSLIAGNSSNGKASSTQYLVMMGCDLGLHERAHLFHDRQLIGGQSL